MNIIRCTNLGKRYGRKMALDKVNLNLQSGQPIALIGANGAGKTTLMSLLCGYIRPSVGCASVLGLAPGSAELNARLGALPQDAQLDPRFSLARQLCLYAKLQGLEGKAAQRDVDRVLDAVGLIHTRQQKPTELSHGMRKRVAIAQALLGTPELVLLDEPTAGLDPANSKIIRDLIVASAKSATFLISSHNLDELEKLCSTVVHLDRGRLKDQVDISGTSREGYLTVKLEASSTRDAVPLLAGLDGVIEVLPKRQGDIVLQYDLATHPAMDQQLLKLLADHQLAYKHLIKGRTLEDRLF